MKNIELLAPVGDFECLMAAVQNGADAVYLGVETFNARYSAKNFNLEDLEKAINYAHIRNVKVHLVLNTLIKNDEFEEVLNIANKAYEFGVDAIIIQDLGLASLLIKNFPDLPIHASTQLTIHNLEGVLEAEKLGFKRVVLSRELSASEIEYICKNSNIEIESFIHGALCISYSGQCLLSSMIGGRSGNRGKCAQACRLPYELIENSTPIEKGYLLSSKDLCGLDYLPQLINAGVCCFKIEGRMKTPEYVATVTRIYRKYIDKVLNNEEYLIEKQDKLDLLQVFNRGNFSSGHLSTEPNKDLIYKFKPNNMGIYIGNVSNYNANKGHISVNLNYPLNLGDTISFERENSQYTVSELMIGNNNIQSAKPNSYIKIGRMKGKIKVGDKIYKLSSKQLIEDIKPTYSGNELIKNKIIAEIDIHENSPITLKVQLLDNVKISTTVYSNVLPVTALKTPITSERIIEQISKTKNTPFEFENIRVNLDNNLYIPSISALNELRRNALSNLENLIISQYKRRPVDFDMPIIAKNTTNNNEHKISLLLNILNCELDYSNLTNIDKLYIPLKYFCNKNYSDILKNLSNTFNTYIYMPTIIRANYRNLFINNIANALNNYNIKGFVISNIGDLVLLKDYISNFEIISNYTLNTFNNLTLSKIAKNNIKTITLSPELNKTDIDNFTDYFNTEFIIYGNLPVMNSNYCLLGRTNKCYPDCLMTCKSSNKYYLKDRMGFLFRIIPDNIQTVTTIYNSKTTFLDVNNLNVNSLRIDILDENIDEINKIIDCIKNGTRFEGQGYTNGNFNRYV